MHRHHRVQNPSVYVDIDVVLARFRSAGGLKHDFQSYKLFQLRQLLERYRPISMLELGLGSSTAVFAAHIRKYGGRLCSVDESASWLANVMKLSGIQEDDNRFEMRHCTAMIGTLNNRDCVGYGLSEEEEFDLILVDGLSLRIDGVKRGDAINDDIFRIADCSPPRMIVVDGRYTTVRALELHLQGRYELEPSALMVGGSPGKNYNYFLIYRRIINQ